MEITVYRRNRSPHQRVRLPYLLSGVVGRENLIVPHPRAVRDRDIEVLVSHRVERKMTPAISSPYATEDGRDFEDTYDLSSSRPARGRPPPDPRAGLEGVVKLRS